MDLIFDFVNMEEEEKFGDSKEDVLKFLKIIGVDTRFVSYTQNKIYINNLRFSKFSRKRENTFYNQYDDIEIVRSSLFQKICSKSSKVLANMEPKDRILVSKDGSPLNELMYIILEPYTRKYGVELVSEGEYDLMAEAVTLDDEVGRIFSDIFDGIGIDFARKKENAIYPLINVPLEWINDFLENDNKEKVVETPISLSGEFMEFLEDVAPQYKDNVLKAASFIEEKLEAEK
ncbi:MAG: ATPase [Methanobrevibacter sp.]|uniref:ATPase n=1 Tax=Methanobrevibacter sp. TaxID=66852 RepID=UPI0026E0DB6A|nr:ATPase [Methanobrevibacter sp.]MDO5847967.1 ATPase [Methanobrevibacter sp.]